MMGAWSCIGRRHMLLFIPIHWSIIRRPHSWVWILSAIAQWLAQHSCCNGDRFGAETEAIWHAINSPKKETGVTLAQQSMPSKCRFASNVEVWERELMDAIYSGVLMGFMEHHKKPVLADCYHALLLNKNIQERKEVMLGRLLDHYKAIKSKLCKAMSCCATYLWNRTRDRISKNRRPKERKQYSWGHRHCCCPRFPASKLG